MPFINTKVNMPLDRQQQREVKERLGRAIALLPGKSEQYLMVGFEPDYPLYFQGDDGERPAAMVEVSVFGSAPAAAYGKLTAAVTNTLSEVLKIDPSRIYVKYSEHQHWGWNGSNF